MGSMLPYIAYMDPMGYAILILTYCWIDLQWKYQTLNIYIHLYPPTPADARGSAPGNKTFEDIWPSTTTTTAATAAAAAAAATATLY